MFPELNYNFEEAEAEDVELLTPQIRRTPLFDFNSNQYVICDGKIVECTEEEAVKQWIGFLVKTAVGKFAVYDNTEFGTYIENYIGYKDAAFVSSEIKREIEEKIVLNRAIEEIADFNYTKDGDKLVISMIVEMKNQTELEVMIDV